MKKHKAKQLIKALRSGRHIQGRGVLVNDDDEFCCLGVTCNISKQPLEWEFSDHYWQIGGCYSELPEDIQQEFGFYSTYGARRDEKHLLINGNSYSCLAVANDAGCSFEQIADYIEEHWEML